MRVHPRDLVLYVLVLRTQLAYGLTSTPHFLITHSLQLFLQSSTVVGLRVSVDGNLCLVTRLYRVVQPLHNGLDSIVE